VLRFVSNQQISSGPLQVGIANLQVLFVSNQQISNAINMFYQQISDVVFLLFMIDCAYAKQ
jgi:hypothetical protein